MSNKNPLTTILSIFAKTTIKEPAEPLIDIEAVKGVFQNSDHEGWVTTCESLKYLPESKAKELISFLKDFLKDPDDLQNSEDRRDEAIKKKKVLEEKITLQERSALGLVFLYCRHKGDLSGVMPATLFIQGLESKNPKVRNHFGHALATKPWENSDIAVALLHEEGGVFEAAHKEVQHLTEHLREEEPSPPPT
ncbi:MAG: hypothetical protein DHS20C02_06520 [Micavibrio sp.]|nr:MAG: hypothetical protein DHS20C02_06520 [Micavibrio sp.]